MTQTSTTTTGLDKVRAYAALPEYKGWWQVPAEAGLLTKGQLAELEFPRQPSQLPAGRVHADDFRGRRNRLIVDLYQPEACPPTTASAAQLAAAANRSNRVRECAECGCHSERPLSERDGRALCPVCSHIQQLRDKQAAARDMQQWAAEQAAAALAEPDAVILHATQHSLPRTKAGRIRPPLSARIRAADTTTGRPLLDVTVSLTGPRARLRDPDAVPAADAAQEVIAVLGGKPLICWDTDVHVLATAVPYPHWPNAYKPQSPKEIRVQDVSTAWRAEITIKGHPIPARHPGAPDRLWLHLNRIANSCEKGS